MNVNPYQPPQHDPSGTAASPAVPPAFLFAAIGAFLASLYWAGLTVLIGLGAAFGSVSPLQTFLPIILIVLYALRGSQLLKGNRNAAKRILWLHGVGGIAAIAQMASGGQLMIVLQSIKLCIHIFGALAALQALRAPAQIPG